MFFCVKHWFFLSFFFGLSNIFVLISVDSNLQTFPPSGAQGKISGGSRPPRDVDGIWWSCLFMFLYSYVVIDYFVIATRVVYCFYLCYVDTFSKSGSGSDEPQRQSGWFQAFSLASYKPYFDVDTIDVLDRIKDSLCQFSGTFNEKTASHPDL